MDTASIRIDASMLLESEGKIVRIMGKCQSFDAPSKHASLEANGTVHLKLVSDDVLTVGNNFEVIGKVGEGQQLQTYSVVELSDNLDLKMASKLVQYIKKVPELYV